MVTFLLHTFLNADDPLTVFFALIGMEEYKSKLFDNLTIYQLLKINNYQSDIDQFNNRLKKWEQLDYEDKIFDNLTAKG